jgi:hypothetical protein
VISSGIEACPWGLNGYGFDQYIAGSPGNAVMALTRYWNDEAHAIAAVEEQNPGRCHRVRYEDMVHDPERVAAGVFDFIGVERLPGITQAIFTPEHERFGPADHKIWHTSTISTDSVGRSDSVPIGLIPPPLLESVNELLDKLGYLRVDESWGTADMPASVLVPTLASAGIEIPEQGEPLPETAVLAERLQAGLSRADDGFAVRWQARMAETFSAAVRQPHGAGSVRWRVDLGADTLIRDDDPSGTVSPEGDGEDADWEVVGTVQAWQEVLTGRLNLSVALRRNELRYCDPGDSDPIASEARVEMLAAFLGLTSWEKAPGLANAQDPSIPQFP